MAARLFVLSMRTRERTVVSKLLDVVGQLAGYPALCALVCFVARVTGVHLHGNESELPVKPQHSNS